MENSLLIIGPDIKVRGVGGVTIHVQRLRDYLEKIGFEYVFKDYKSNSVLALWQEMSCHKIIHVHISNPVYQFIVVLWGRLHGKKVVVTLHGDYGRFGKLKNRLVKTSMKLATVPIVINEKSYEACKIINKNATLIPAFIPPQKEEVLQKEIVDLLVQLHSEGKKIVSTNASNTAVDKLGNDIYGIDFLVRYYKDSQDYALVVSDPSGNYKKRYETLHSNSVFFIDYPHPYFQVLKQVDYFVRNTSTDGDALSVKEALYLKVPAICTDVVDRPEGVRLFKYCEEDSFVRCFYEKSNVESSIVNGAEKVVGVYNTLKQ